MAHPAHDANSLTRGFTGHEQMDAECLINANARIYDPTLGRFMSADSVVPAPYDGQAFNRYAYVGNNPLLPAKRCSANFNHHLAVESGLGDVRR